MVTTQMRHRDSSHHPSKATSPAKPRNTTCGAQAAHSVTPQVCKVLHREFKLPIPPGHPVPVSGSQAALYHMGKVLPTLQYRQPARLSCPKVAAALVRHKNKGETKQKIGILSSFLLLLPSTSSAFLLRHQDIPSLH